jgi:hypothetical protein
MQAKAIAPIANVPISPQLNELSLNLLTVSTQVNPQQQQSDRISACNGLPGGANFRVEPSMQGQVLSVLAIGFPVQKTEEIKSEGNIQFQKVIVGNQVG